MERAEAGLRGFGAEAAKAGAAATKLAQDAQRAATMASMHARNLNYQLVDIAQGLPLLFQSPTYGLINLGNQFAQIGQSYFGQGGLGAAFRDIGRTVGGLAVKLAPVGVAIGGITALFAGLTREINKTADVQVSLGDTMLATVQVIAGAIGNVLGPAVNQIGTWMGQLWDFIAPPLKAVGNAIIGTFRAAFDDIQTTWSLLPNALGDLAIQGANKVVAAVHDMLRESLLQISLWARQLASVPVIGGLATGVQALAALSAGGEAPQIPNPLAGSAGLLAKTNPEALGTDYLGGLFGAISAQAQKLAVAVDDGTKKGTSAARTHLGHLVEATNSMADMMRSAFSGVGSAIVGAFKQGGDVGMNVFNALIGKVGDFGEALLNKGFDALLNIGVNALFPTGGAFGKGLWGTAIFGGAGSPLSFAGGGYTGTGARAGGIDGQGGFLAMLHPNETVLDHDRGQGAGPTIHFSITGSQQDAAAIARAVGDIVKRQLPDAIQRYNRNPNLRTV